MTAALGARKTGMRSALATYSAAGDREGERTEQKERSESLYDETSKSNKKEEKGRES